LENLGDISQVEGVVGLARSWLHRTIQYLVIDLKLCLDKLRQDCSNIITETGKEGLNNSCEDNVDSSEVHLSVGNDVEVALKTLSYNGTTTTRGTHCRDKNNVNDGEPWLFFVITIIPATKVHKLTKKFNWWLSSILFFLGHVKIINEANEFLSKRGSPAVLSAFLKLGLQVVLSLISRSLS